MGTKQKKKVNSPKNVASAGPPAFNPQQQAQASQPGAGGPVPPPVPNMNSGNANGGPPPAPPGGMSGGGGGGGVPPPIPGSDAYAQPTVPPPKQKLTAQEMAARSRAAMEEKMQSEAPPSAAPPQAGPPKMNALMASIRGGASLKKAVVVKREPRMEKRDLMLMALKKKGQTGL